MTAAAPLISVVIPVYAGERFLGEAIDSALAQTHEAVEAIVVDDGSPDASAEIAAARAGVTLLRRARAGVAAARNAGVEAASGELIAFLDQDDVMHPDKLRKQLAALDAQPEASLAFCHVETALEPGVARPSWVPEDALRAPRPGHVPSTWLLRRAAWEAVGPLDTSYEITCDGDWLKRFGEAGGRSVMLDEPLLRWRVHGANGSYDRETMRREMLTVVRRGVARAAG